MNKNLPNFDLCLCNLKTHHWIQMIKAEAQKDVGKRGCKNFVQKKKQ